MATGRKDYFRHSNHALSDIKIQAMIDEEGWEYYGKFWALLETFAIEYTQTGEKEIFTVRESQLSSRLKSNSRGVASLLKVMGKHSLMFPTNIGECYKETLTKLSGNIYQIKVPNFYKYIGSYPQEIPRKTPNKKKRKEKKRNYSFLPLIENIYSDFYPNKKGKSNGLKKLDKEIKSDSDLAELEKAIKNYAADCKKNETPNQYVKHFSTFSGEWKDWIDYKTEASATEKFEDDLADFFEGQINEN